MTLDKTKSILEKHNQLHLLEHFDSLTNDDKNDLILQIDKINWSFLHAFNNLSSTPSTSLITPMDILKIPEIKRNTQLYKNTGINAIKNGKLCLLLLAGGQGTRLGFDHSKGMFDVGITKPLYIFELLINNTLEVVKQSNTWIHLYIMTSEINHDDTVSFFEKHNHFDYNKDFIHFFKQDILPSTDFDGKILMNSKAGLAMAPNGNGGWFTSLQKDTSFDLIINSDIEWINVFSVDNVLQGIADPVFLGATINSGLTCGSKVVKKDNPHEKVGSICKKDGHPHIIEYFEMTDDMINQRDSNGAPAFGYGVTLNYLFPISKLRQTLSSAPPLHLARKIIPYIDNDGLLITPDKPNGYKYETLALDLINQMDSCLAFEIDRGAEFAPIKNKTGNDSIDTARILLQKNGYEL